MNGPLSGCCVLPTPLAQFVLACTYRFVLYFVQAACVTTKNSTLRLCFARPRRQGRICTVCKTDRPDGEPHRSLPRHSRTQCQIAANSNTNALSPTQVLVLYLLDSSLFQINLNWQHDRHCPTMRKMGKRELHP